MQLKRNPVLHYLSVKKAKPYMYQEFEELETIEVQAQDADTARNTAQSSYYTPDDLAAQLEVKRRMIFTYAKTICEAWYWEPEVTFKPVFGKYSHRALEEMKRLQAMGTEAYAQFVSSQQQTQPAVKVSSLVKNHTVSLDQKITRLQRETTVASSSLADRIRQKLVEINHSTNQQRQRQTALDDAEIQVAENRGLEKALALFEAEERAKEETLAQLRALKIQQKNA